jgi:hypothetical protein
VSWGQGRELAHNVAGCRSSRAGYHLVLHCPTCPPFCLAIGQRVLDPWGSIPHSLCMAHATHHTEASMFGNNPTLPTSTTLGPARMRAFDLLGTLTLKRVRPMLDQNGKLLGWVEA